MPFRRAALTLFAAAVLLGASATPAAAEPARVVILRSGDAPAYQQASEGFRRHLEQHGVSTTGDVHTLGGDAAEARAVVRSLDQEGVRLVFALGTLATQTACAELTHTPVVASLVLTGEDLEPVAHATGVVMDFPVATQLEWIRRVLPRQKRIGVLYNPAINGDRVASASRLAEEMGCELVALAVRSPRDLPDALKLLAKQADVLWGITDPTVISPQTAKQILLFSFRNRIPLVGLSATWVKAGALYALERDYTDLGAQCGEIAVRILQGEPPHTLPPATPRTVAYALNLKTARHMRIDIPGELLRGATQVFE